jgi:UDP-3-O-[3-hydroxymyristoyl] glucosamine N-acyltransferase
MVNNLSKIEEGTNKTLSFLANPIYTNFIYTTDASIVIVNKTLVLDKPVKPTCTLIRVENAYESFAKLLELYTQIKGNKVGIEQPSFISENTKMGTDCYVGAFAYIGQNVTIGNNVKLYPHIFIGDNCVIGDNTVLFSGVKLYYECKIGANCTIHANTVIGSDGFGFAPNADGNAFAKVPQIGNVVIEDNVGIGALCTIDKGVTGDTTIGEGTKIDNQVHVGHDTVIGKKCLIAAQTGIAGCVIIEDEVTLWGQVGTTSGITIGSKAIVLGQTGVSKSIEGGKTYSGTPIDEAREKMKQFAYLKKIPEILNKIK